MMAEVQATGLDLAQWSNMDGMWDLLLAPSRTCRLLYAVQIYAFSLESVFVRDTKWDSSSGVTQAIRDGGPFCRNTYL